MDIQNHYADRQDVWLMNTTYNKTTVDVKNVQQFNRKIWMEDAIWQT
jgi:hypothetical protein